MNSCIYVGQVRHRRFAPRRHEFSYKLFMLYLDLDELPSIFKRFLFWSTRRFNLAWFCRNDHLGAPDKAIIDAVRERVEQETGCRPAGPIRLLTHLRYFGYGFNPVSFYYCFDHSGNHLETIVAEVNNTPWGEQHVYVLPLSHAEKKGELLRFKRDKEFHISPFMPMNISYDWRFSLPGQRLNIHMENHHEENKLFDATLKFRRLPITSFNLTHVLAGYPLITMKVTATIYFEALRLWLKKTPTYCHPNKKEASAQTKRI